MGRLVELKGSSRGAQGEIGVAQGEIGGAQEELDGDWRSSSRAQGELKGRLAELKGRLAELKGRLAELKGRLAELKGSSRGDEWQSAMVSARLLHELGPRSGSTRAEENERDREGGEQGDEGTHRRVRRL